MQLPAMIGALLLLISPAMAQFFNFGNMFGQQQQQQQEPQNMASDSDWYQQNYDGGMYAASLFAFFKSSYTDVVCSSTLRQIPLPTYALLRAFPTPLSLRIPQHRG